MPINADANPRDLRLRRPAGIVPEPQPGEPLWTVMRGTELRHAELRDHGTNGCELQILNQARLVQRQHYENRALAVSAADVICDVLLRQGWTDATTSSGT